jgi:Ankyrin repeats (3 copies)
MVQPFLLSTDADCLILLDCCYAAKGAKDSGTILRGTNEVIAACSPESRTTGVERRSFTSVLIRQLEEFAHAFRKCGQKFTAVGLHSALFRFSRELQYGPFYVRLTNSEYSSIDLTPLPTKATVSADGDSDIHMGLSTEGDAGSESSSLNSKPKAIAKVLVAIHLTKSPRGDLVGFLRGEGLIPSYVNAMEVLAVEAVFESNSVLAIISMPISVWDLLPEDTPCSYIGITYSKNLLDSNILPQSLSGLGLSKGEDASVPTHYHSPSEEKKMITGENTTSVSEAMACPKNQVNASCEGPEARLTTFLKATTLGELGNYDVSECDLDYHRTALHWAAVLGYIKVLETLLDKGADTFALDKHRATPLHYAAKFQRRSCAEALLGRLAERGIPQIESVLRLRDEDGRTPADCANHAHWFGEMVTGINSVKKETAIRKSLPRPQDPQAAQGSRAIIAQSESHQPTMERSGMPALNLWWFCSECESMNNPALTAGRCSMCGHAKCAFCRTVPGDPRKA